MPRPAPVEHGTRKAYRELGCRCDSCAEWRRRSMRDYWAQRREEGRPRTRKPRTLFAQTCQQCQSRFESAHRQSYCSLSCANRSRKRHDSLNRGKFTISPRLRREIYERDGWVCQLCFEPVDRDVHYLDDWAPSLDHIEPQSFALLPDHSPENLRTAHRWCNSVRGVNDPNGLFEEVRDVAP